MGAIQKFAALSVQRTQQRRCAAQRGPDTMPVLDGLAVSLVPAGRPNDELERAWMPDTDPKGFVELVRSHFMAKVMVRLFKFNLNISFD